MIKMVRQKEMWEIEIRLRTREIRRVEKRHKRGEERVSGPFIGFLGD